MTVTWNSKQDKDGNIIWETNESPSGYKWVLSQYLRCDRVQWDIFKYKNGRRHKHSNALTLDEAKSVVETLSIQEGFKKARKVRKSRLYQHNGVWLTISQWSSKLGISMNTLYNRLSLKWPIESVFESFDHRKKHVKTRIRKKLNIIGNKYNKWEVIDYAEDRKYKNHLIRYYKCKCECGTIREVAYCNLTGQSKSCGMCKRKKYRHIKHSKWIKMISKLDINTLCDEWKTYDGFCDTVTEIPPKTPKPIAIDSSKKIGPDNVKWVGSTFGKFSERNNSRMIEHDGIRLNINQWAKKLGLSRYTIHARLKSGWTESEAVSTPKMDLEARKLRAKRHGRKLKLWTINGESHTAIEWTEKLGITLNVFYCRLRSGSVVPRKRGVKKKIWTFDGISKTTDEWAEKAGIKRYLMVKHLRNGVNPLTLINNAHNN